MGAVESYAILLAIPVLYVVPGNIETRPDPSVTLAVAPPKNFLLKIWLDGILFL